MPTGESVGVIKMLGVVVLALTLSWLAQSGQIARAASADLESSSSYQSEEEQKEDDEEPDCD